MTALSLARERAPSIPFLIVTGSVNEETAVGCIKAGATDYLLKSNLARIGPAIEAALERSRAQAERLRAEAALAASERRFRSLVQNSSDLVIIVDRNGTIRYASAVHLPRQRLVVRPAGGGTRGWYPDRHLAAVIDQREGP